MSKHKGTGKTAKKTFVSPFKNYWKKENYILLLVGVLLLIIGYTLMANDPWDNPIALTLSPIILLLAYLVIFPLSIFYRKNKNSQMDKSDNVSSQS
ncbi:MAG: hypothetical protein KAQ90_05610 [Melioribacteraceae bacterium]|nr:hypothetical protein [Melioribacteraceae bacterium]